MKASGATKRVIEERECEARREMGEKQDQKEGGQIYKRDLDATSVNWVITS